MNEIEKHIYHQIANRSYDPARYIDENEMHYKLCASLLARDIELLMRGAFKSGTKYDGNYNHIADEMIANVKKVPFEILKSSM